MLAEVCSGAPRMKVYFLPPAKALARFGTPWESSSVWQFKQAVLAMYRPRSAAAYSGSDDASVVCGMSESLTEGAGGFWSKYGKSAGTTLSFGGTVRRYL